MIWSFLHLSGQMKPAQFGCDTKKVSSFTGCHKRIVCHVLRSNNSTGPDRVSPMPVVTYSGSYESEGKCNLTVRNLRQRHCDDVNQNGTNRSKDHARMPLHHIE